MTANGFSSYELFVKMDTFQLTLRLKVSTFVKKHFFILSHSNIVYKGFCVPTSETSCSSHVMKTNIFCKQIVSYLASAQSARTKMTAIGFSSYELFVKMDTFQLTLRLKVCSDMKKHFFVLSH